MGAKFGGGGDDEIIADINITPMVDIILVLLIIFLVTSPMMFQPTIPIELPSAATAESGADTELGVSIGANGELLLNGKPTTEEGIVATIEELLAKGDDPVLLISADKKVSHGAVVRVLDLVREAGVTRFAINVDPVVPE